MNLPPRHNEVRAALPVDEVSYGCGGIRRNHGTFLARLRILVRYAQAALEVNSRGLRAILFLAFH